MEMESKRSDSYSGLFSKAESKMGKDYSTVSGSKGIFLSKTAIVLSSICVVALLVAEGLIIGLVGRPDCDPVQAPVPDSTTKPGSTTTSPAGASTTPAETGPWSNVRLPLNLIPEAYDVELRPILQADSDGKYWFKGSATIRYQCKEPTKHVILHSNKLEYYRGNISLQREGADVAMISTEFYEPNQFLVIETTNPCIQDANYTLTVSDFTGELADDLSGLYRSEYDKSTGEHVVIATTQMQATDARKTFPCFDEPAMKAKFRITLWYRADMAGFDALSNMPVESTKSEIIDGVTWNANVFEESVPMSTYLLAMVVSDFTSADNSTKDGIETKIYCREEKVDVGDAAYAALITPHILDFFVDYFKVPYPLPKSDQIGVPDFGAGAMENWGLVIYREPYILYNENTTTINYKVFITSIISHELAHQWFGNLVSPAWWDELWLNEGFATYVSYLGEADVQPTWKSKERFVTDDLQGAFSADELTTSHPLVQQVNTPNEISSQFDTISYNKGASVLRMINGFMGETNFVNGLTEYLNALEYNVATHNDLFGYWAKHTTGLGLPTDLATILETWTLQMGYPVVTIRDQEPLTMTFTVTQDYFLIDPDAEPVHTEGSLKYGYKWYIPFTFIRGSNLAAGVEETIWISPGQTVILEDSEFILGNIRAIGFYRVDYDADTWQKISAALDSTMYTNIPEENRAQLIDDSYSLASAKRLRITVPLELSQYLHRDDSYIAWLTFMRNIKYFEYMLGRTPIFGSFSKYILDLVVPSLYDKFGWEESDKSDSALIERMTRQVGIDAACYYGHQDCIDTAVGKFNQWMAKPENTDVITTSFRSDILCTAIRNSGIVEWNFAWQMHTTLKDSQWQTSLRYGLACSKDPWILNRFLEYTLNASLIRKQDAIRTIEYVGREEYGRDIAWSFMVENWDTLVELFGSGWSFDGLISSLTRRFSTDYDLQKVQSFKDNTENLATASRAVDQAIEKTKANIKWRADNEETLTEWFNENT